MAVTNWLDFYGIVHVRHPTEQTAVCGDSQARQRKREPKYKHLFRRWTKTEETATCVFCIGGEDA